MDKKTGSQVNSKQMTETLPVVDIAFIVLILQSPEIGINHSTELIGKYGIIDLVIR